MKKILFCFVLCLLCFVAFSSKSNVSALTKTPIQSTDWMSFLPDDIKITDINIPGVHDAGTAHTTATVSAQYTICQQYYIGNHTYKSYNLFTGSKEITEPGLLEQGVRYFDIRYDLHEYDPDDEDDVAEAQKEIKKVGEAKWAADHLELCHGIFTCRYLDSVTIGWNDWEDITGTKLLEWTNNFLTNHPDEVVIFAVSCEDNKDDVSELIRKLYTNLALNKVKGFPEVYYGYDVPTLGEARGKVVLIADVNGDLGLYDSDDNYIGNWAFKTKYSRGDETNKTYEKCVESNLNRYRVYKNNQYDGVDEDGKWEWVENGLRDAEKFYNASLKDGYDPFMVLYTSANDISNYRLLRSPQGFAEDINPKVYNHIKEYNDKKEWHYFGILAMDFMNDSRYGADMATQIWSSNFYRDYNFVDWFYTGANFEYIDNSPKTGTSVGSGSIYIIIGGCIIIAGVTVGAILIAKKRKKTLKK